MDIAVYAKRIEIVRCFIYLLKGFKLSYII